MNWQTQILDMQTDAAARLESAAYLSDIVILQQSKGVVESDVETALGVFNTETGKKIGAVIICIMPEIGNNASEAPGLDLTAVFSFHVITLPLINNDTANGGSGKSAEALATCVLTELHRYLCGSLRVEFGAAAKPITPLQTTEDGVVSYLVQLEARFYIDRRDIVATPDYSRSGHTATLTCATAGAVIYYTTDGSYPGEQNATSIQYTAPFTVANGDTLRAVAILANYIPSGSLYVGVVIEEGITTEGGDTITTEGGDTIIPES